MMSVSSSLSSSSKCIDFIVFMLNLFIKVPSIALFWFTVELFWLLTYIIWKSVLCRLCVRNYTLGCIESIIDSKTIFFGELYIYFETLSIFTIESCSMIVL